MDICLTVASSCRCLEGALCLIRWGPPRATRTDTRCPYATLFRSKSKARAVRDSIAACAVNDMRLANQYGGVSTSGREFVSRFVLSEDFFGNLMEHSVPMNERAFVEIGRAHV